MSRVSFASLAESQPDLAASLDAFEKWLDSHPRVHYIELRRVINDLIRRYPELEQAAVVVAIAEGFRHLVESGLARRAYRILDPEGHQIGQDFYSLADIPDDLVYRGDFYRSFSPLVEGDVVSGVVLEAANGVR